MQSTANYKFRWLSIYKIVVFPTIVNIHRAWVSRSNPCFRWCIFFAKNAVLHPHLHPFKNCNNAGKVINSVGQYSNFATENIKFEIVRVFVQTKTPFMRSQHGYFANNIWVTIIIPSGLNRCDSSLLSIYGKLEEIMRLDWTNLWFVRIFMACNIAMFVARILIFYQ